MSGYSSFSLGQGVITTEESIKMLIEDQSNRSQKVKEKIDFLNDQYQFKDEIPKGVTIIKTNQEISDERYEEIMFGIGQLMRDQALVVFDKRTISAWFKDLEIKMKVYVLILSCMIMVLTFFMLIVAFT